MFIWLVARILNAAQWAVVSEISKKCNKTMLILSLEQAVRIYRPLSVGLS